ncbi:hypothetical protein MMC31_001088 [Peltigera leucophlebia]|nr:hypothetical protein [Peltigera leucophlebia]
MSMVNIWHLRKVAEASARPCDICYKPTSAVLITPDNQDHFYICQSHVKDRGFCLPIVDEAEVAARKKKEEMDREIEIIKKEYEEKRKKIKGKDSKAKKEDKDEDKEMDIQKEDRKKSAEDDKAEREKEEKIRAVTENGSTPSIEYIPRIYTLQKVFYQKRLDRKRTAEIARRSQERFNALKNPSLFPSVPKDNLG